jgi:Signal transduction histidine kinase
MKIPLTAYQKRWVLLLLLILPGLYGYADTLHITSSDHFLQPIKLDKWFSIWEDSNKTTTADRVLALNNGFLPLSKLQPHHPTNVYWLKTTIRYADSNAAPLALLFTSLTFVDAWLSESDQFIWHGSAGAFRPEKDITPGDGRFYFHLPLGANHTYTLLLRVHHTKYYQPVFDFALQQRDAFLEKNQQLKLIDGWMQGAVSIFFLYVLLCWLVSRFRPYLWLLLFIGGAGFYGICTNGYFIDWFFPDNPAIGWIFNLPFLDIGVVGIYLLVLDFWELRRYNPVLYRLGIIGIIILVVNSIIGISIDYFTGNFNLANNLQLMEFVVPGGFILAALITCRKRLNRAQYYLYYGIILMGVAGLFVTLSSALIHEKSLHIVPYISNAVILLIFLLFSIGLKESLRQHEIEKNVALNALNELQKKQNQLLETKVEERTRELQKSNEELARQQAELSERNVQIATLINELSHRVKNNLQLLYSLHSLQISHIQDASSKEILRSNLARIQAMMLVNNKLTLLEDGQPVTLSDFITGLVLHVQQVYDTHKKIRVEQSVPSQIRLQPRHTLSIGLILSELLTNSFKYAFPNIAYPVITIEAAYAQDNRIRLFYADNGVGLQDLPGYNKRSMGLSLIKDMVRQMHGDMRMDHDQGLSYTFTFPVTDSKYLQHDTHLNH